MLYNHKDLEASPEELASDELRALRAQRDELLAVAQEAAGHYARLVGDDTSCTPLRARLERASAAIARATGKQEASR